MKHGKIIVFEGLDGSGKCTQSKILVDKLRSMGKNSQWVSIPNYNSLSSGPVKMYLNCEISKNLYDINPYAASSFFAVDRIVNYLQIWKKNYEKEDSIIVCDRYSTSNMIYQLAKTDRNNWDNFLDWVCDLEYNKFKIPHPDIVIYLKVPIQVSQELIKARSSPDLHESNLEFLYSCAEAAEYSAKKFNWCTVDCSKDENSIQSVDDISLQVLDLVNKKNII